MWLSRGRNEGPGCSKMKILSSFPQPHVVLCLCNLYAFVSSQNNIFWKMSHFVHTVKVTGFHCIYKSCWNIIQNISCVPGNMYPFKGWALLYLLHSSLYDDLFLPLNWDWNVLHVNRVSLHSQRVYTEHHTYTHTSLCVSLIPTSAKLLDLLPQM